MGIKTEPPGALELVNYMNIDSEVIVQYMSRKDQNEDLLFFT